MALIQVENLTFGYEGSYETIFENVSFQMDSNWKLGFTGRNGRGKTTFLNLLQGKLPYSGSISAGVEFAYFPYPVANPQSPALEVLEAITPSLVHWQLLRELSLLQVDEEVLTRPYHTLSGGEQTKLLLAALFLGENRFLLIDEPTNHLDISGRRLLGSYLQAKKGFILVSHDRAFLDSCIDHILVINKTNIELQRGNFSSWWENKQRQDAFEQAENQRLQKDIKRLSAAAKRSAGWSDAVEKSKNLPLSCGISADKGYIGHKAAKMMKRAKAIEARQQAAVEQKSALLKNLETTETLKIAQVPYHATRLAALDEVCIFYGQTQACPPVSFSIERGDRIALTGKNGSGKSSLLKLICGQPLAYTGNFYRGSRLNVSYLSQDTSFLQGSLAAYARENGLEESLFKAILRKLDFSRPQLEKDMAHFSGGQKKKVLLAASLCQKTHLHVWDEPLNFIDVLSRMQIEQLLLSCQPTILFVEHDSAFCQAIATKSVCLD